MFCQKRHGGVHGSVDISPEIVEVQDHIQMMRLTPADAFFNRCKRAFIQFPCGLVIEQISVYRQSDMVESPCGDLPDILFRDEGIKM